MKTVFSIGLLIVFGVAAKFLSVFLLNIAGLPGALMAGMPGKRSKKRFVFGSIVAAIGQCYVYLGYIAFVVSWTKLVAGREDVVGVLLWPFAFLAVLIPIWSSLMDAKGEAQEYEFANPQVEALHLTVLAAMLGFFVFAFAPSVIRTPWGWIPYVSSPASNVAIHQSQHPTDRSEAAKNRPMLRTVTEQAQLEQCAMAVLGCVHFSASEDPSDLATVASGKQTLKAMVQEYDKTSFDEICSLVDESLRFERSLQKDLVAYMENASRTGKASKFTISEPTKQILDKLPTKLRAFMEVNVVAMEKLDHTTPNLTENWREQIDMGAVRTWTKYGQTYSELLGRPMPTATD